MSKAIKMAKIKAVIVGDTPKNTPKASPPNVACDIPTLIKDQFFKYTNRESIDSKEAKIIPPIKLLTIKLSKALFINIKILSIIYSINPKFKV